MLMNSEALPRAFSDFHEKLLVFHEFVNEFVFIRRGRQVDGIVEVAVQIDFVLHDNG